MLDKNESVDQAAQIMLDFAERTGLRSKRATRRYLWTDAFAVCNFLALAQCTADDAYRSLAVSLIEQVHGVLGRHRDDDERRGWLSGLGEAEGALHPTRGGLRIGKKLPERRPGEPYDERLEWDRDGQYFHYLTKWMHALDQAARTTREPSYHVWSRELAEVAHAAFCHGSAQSGGRRMTWKMSTDLRRPLVPAMGQHDPLDGLLTCLQIRSTAAALPGAPKAELAAAIRDYAGMLDLSRLGTDDPLGLGGLLMDLSRAVQLVRDGAFEGEPLLRALSEAASEGLRHYARQHDSTQAAARRLAFRELGLSIGISCLDLTRSAISGEAGPSAARLGHVLDLELPWRLAAVIRDFWLRPEHQRSFTWIEHHDINQVMLATSLIPESMLIAPIAG